MNVGMTMRAAALAMALGATAGLAPQASQATERPAPGEAIEGRASWYGGKFHGRRTANGERFDMDDLTAAHRTLPFGAKVRVTNARNGRSVIVRINDRGPFIGGRVIDLSRGAAAAIGMVRTGVAPVRIERL